MNEPIDRVGPNDRRLITALEEAIADPGTSEEKRAEYREELGGIAMGYIDVLDEDEEREWLRKRAESAAQRGDEPELAWARARLRKLEVSDER